MLFYTALVVFSTFKSYKDLLSKGVKFIICEKLVSYNISIQSSNIFKKVLFVGIKFERIG